MKKKTNLWYLLSAIMLVSSLGLQAQEKILKRKVAIGRFSNETQYAKSVFYDKEKDPMGKQASDILSTKLGATDKFLLIERQDFDKIIQEANTGGGSLQTIGADYLIIGSITEYGRKNVGTQKMFTSSKTQIVEAAVAIRLVDASTGVVVFTGEAKGEATAEDKTVLGLGKVADFDATLSDKAIAAAITKLVESIVNKCMDNPWKSYLLSYEDGVLVISGGKSQGLEAGDVYTLAEKGKKVKNPQTGILIELPSKNIGRIKIVQTVDGATPETEVSMASIEDGTVDPNTLDKYIVLQPK